MSMIELNETPSAGRYVTAGRPISGGELVHASMPYAVTMHPSVAKTRCRRCYGAITTAGAKATIATNTCTICSTASYCSCECREAHQDNYHSGSTASTAIGYYGEECAAAYLIHELLGEQIKKGRSAEDLHFLTLMVSVFIKVEAETRGQRGGIGSSDGQQVCTWLRESLSLAPVKKEGASQPEQKSNATASSSERQVSSTAAEPAEVAKIAALQQLMGELEVADPVYIKSTAGRQAEATKRLRGALEAVESARWLKGSSGAPSPVTPPKTDISEKAPVTPNWLDLASLVSNHSVIGKERMSEYKVLHRMYLKVRTLLGLASAEGTEAHATTSGSEAMPSIAGAKKSADKPEKVKKSKVKPGMRVTANTKKQLEQKAAAHAAANKKKSKQAEGSDAEDQLEGEQQASADETDDVVPDFAGLSKRGGADASTGAICPPQTDTNTETNAFLAKHFVPEVSEFIFTSVCSALQCNGFGIYDKTDTCVAIGFYPFASYFNHSCDPNIARVMVGNEVRFYALFDIKAGEPLCISYVDVDRSTSERRSVLLKTYRFYCKCCRCAGEGKLQCIRCSKCAAKGYLRPLEDGVTGECTVCKLVTPFSEGLR